MKPQYRRRREPRRPLQSQMPLALPPVPRESPLRNAFRSAELACVGIEFRAVMSNRTGVALLRMLAEAYASGDQRRIQMNAGRLIRMRGALR